MQIQTDGGCGLGWSQGYVVIGGQVGMQFQTDDTTQPRSQYPLTHPHSTLASAALKNFASVSCILLLCKATVSWPRYSFSFRFHLYMSQRRSPASRTTLSPVVGMCRSVPLPYLFVSIIFIEKYEKIEKFTYKVRSSCDCYSFPPNFSCK